MSAPAPKPFSLQAPERIAMEYGGNKQKIAQAVQSGLIDPTSGLMAGMFIDRMRAAQAQEQAPNQTVAQQVLGPQGPQGGPPPGGPQGGPPPGGPPPPPPPQGGPPPQGPVGMAEGGLTSLPVPDYMFDEQTFAGGGIVAFARGDQVDARAERLKALMSVVRNPNASSEDRMAARAEINKMEGMGPGRTPGPGLADALAYTQDDLPFRQPVSADASIYSPDGARAPQNVGDEPINVGPRARAPQSAGDSIYSPGGGMGLPSRSPQGANAFTGADGLTADYSLEADYPRVTAGPNKGKTLSELTAAARAANEASGQVPFKGLGRALLPFPEREALEAKERAEAQARPPAPSASGYKPNLGSVNMGGYDPNRSSPEAQLNAILGKPAPDTRIGALLASQSARADTAPTRVPGAGRRTGAGAATTRPSASTTAAGTTPEMSDEALAEQRRKEFLEASKLPEYKGTSAEDKAARKKEDFWSAMAQAGFGMMAGTSQNALTNIGEGLKAAMPTMQASLKERRADEKEDLKQQYAYQLAQAGVSSKAFEVKMTQFDKLKDNRFREKTLAETIRHNQEVEKLQGQQVAQSGSTGTERLVRVIALGRAPGATDEQKRLADAAEYALKGYAGAVGGAEIANKARDNVDSAISKNINLSRTLNDLAKKDRANAKTGNPTTLYEDKYNEMIDAEQKRLGRGLLGKQTPEDPLGLLKG